MWQYGWVTYNVALLSDLRLIRLLHHPYPQNSSITLTKGRKWRQAEKFSLVQPPPHHSLGRLLYVLYWHNYTAP